MSGCGQCKKYGALHKPWKIADAIYVHGFCFKDVHASYGSAYPVYLPNSGTCHAFEKRKKKRVIMGTKWHRSLRVNFAERT